MDIEPCVMLEMRVEIYPGSEGLNGGHNPGHQLTPGDSREITGQGLEGQAAE